MPACATRGEKYQAGPTCDNDVHAMQRTLETEYDVSLARACHHYKVRLTNDVNARRQVGRAPLVVSDVRGYKIPMILQCGKKNA